MSDDLSYTNLSRVELGIWGYDHEWLAKVIMRKSTKKKRLVVGDYVISASKDEKKDFGVTTYRISVTDEHFFLVGELYNGGAMVSPVRPAFGIKGLRVVIDMFNLFQEEYSEDLRPIEEYTERLVKLLRKKSEVYDKTGRYIEGQ